MRTTDAQPRKRLPRGRAGLRHGEPSERSRVANQPKDAPNRSPNRRRMDGNTTQKESRGREALNLGLPRTLRHGRRQRQRHLGRCRHVEVETAAQPGASHVSHLVSRLASDLRVTLGRSQASTPSAAPIFTWRSRLLRASAPEGLIEDYLQGIVAVLLEAIASLRDWHIPAPRPAPGRPCGRPCRRARGSVASGRPWPPGRALVAVLGLCRSQSSPCCSPRRP